MGTETLSDKMQHAAGVCGEAAPVATSFSATSKGRGKLVSIEAVGRDVSERVCSASGASVTDCWLDDVTEAGILRRMRYSMLVMSVSDLKSVVPGSASGWLLEGPTLKDSGARGLAPVHALSACCRRGSAPKRPLLACQ